MAQNTRTSKPPPQKKDRELRTSGILTLDPELACSLKVSDFGRSCCFAWSFHQSQSTVPLLPPVSASTLQRLSWATALVHNHLDVMGLSVDRDRPTSPRTWSAVEPKERWTTMDVAGKPKENETGSTPPETPPETQTPS